MFYRRLYPILIFLPVPFENSLPANCSSNEHVIRLGSINTQEYNKHTSCRVQPTEKVSNKNIGIVSRVTNPHINIFHLPSEYNKVNTWHIHPIHTNYLITTHAILKTFIKRNSGSRINPSKLLLYFLLLVISQSNDIEINPGPSNDSTKYTCGTCDNTVTWEHKGIVCETCDQWFHVDCQNIDSKTYDILNDSTISWHCLICGNPNYSICPFDLHGISSSKNTFDNLHHSMQDENSSGLSTPTNRFKPSHQSTYTHS